MRHRPAQPQFGHGTSEATLQHLRGHSDTTEELTLESSVQDNVTQNYTSVSSSRSTISSNFGDWNAEKEFVLDEPVSVANSALQISSEESRSTIEEVIGVLRNLTGSEAESETSLETSSSSTLLQASETERKAELSGTTEFTSDYPPSSSPHQEEVEHQRELSTVHTQTDWISWDTPATSATELQMELSEESKQDTTLDHFSDSETPRIIVGAERSSSSNTDITERQESKHGESETEDVVAEQSESEPESDNDSQHLMINTKNIILCEFCKQIRLPFPTPEALDSKGPEELFCCNMSWMLYQQILMGRAENPYYKEVSLKHHGFLMTNKELSEAKAKLLQRIKNPEVEMYMTSVVHGDKVIFTPPKTISYKLSSEYCRKQGWTLRAISAVFPKSEDFTLYIPSVQSYKEPKRPLGVVEKYYSSGQKFLTRFPDGTGNIFYPSGNIAMVISAFHQDQFVYLIFQDVDWNAKLLGVFRSNGHGTCYLPNGLIWINVTPLCGSYFTKQGLTKKRWLWRDYNYHVHAPPYHSIRLKLNSNISVRVISRNQIYTTFETRKRGVRFNMGAKLVLRDLEHFHALESNITREEKYLKAVSQKIHRILQQMHDLRITHNFRMLTLPQLSNSPTSPRSQRD
ncbi:glutamate-rich protein 6-like isoform X2 [Heterodontus francisci]|uniref:glutamate-rich protein 6-like isoform X2 n=1 Tax=Heterodontus francisci TaxID=7792 RepID=UPI00355C0660